MQSRGNMNVATLTWSWRGNGCGSGAVGNLAGDIVVDGGERFILEALDFGRDVGLQRLRQLGHGCTVQHAVTHLLVAGEGWYMRRGQEGNGPSVMSVMKV